MSKSKELTAEANGTCKWCPSGSFECGNPRDLCTSSMQAVRWEPMGTISFKILTGKINGEIVVKIEPMQEPIGQ